MQVATIGLDLAKNVFQIHGTAEDDVVVFNRPLRRAQVLPFFASLKPRLIGMESCSSAHHWARELTTLGHDVRLIPPMYVKPYVKRGKSDAIDAEAICEAVMRELEHEIGTVSYYAGAEMDPLARVQSIPELQVTEAWMFSRYLKTVIDIRTGLITMTVRARTAQDATRFSEAILARTEAHVNDLAEALFSEQISQEERTVAQTRENLERARLSLIKVQIASGEANPRARIEGIYGAIASLERDLLDLEAGNARNIIAGHSETNSEMRKPREQEAPLKARIDTQRTRLIDDNAGPSLNERLVDYDSALVQVELAERSWAAALLTLEEARYAAALGAARFQVVVPPQTAGIATFPRRMEVTALALFLSAIFLAGLRVFFGYGRYA